MSECDQLKLALALQVYPHYSLSINFSHFILLPEKMPLYKLCNKVISHSESSTCKMYLLSNYNMTHEGYLLTSSLPDIIATMCKGPKAGSEDLQEVEEQKNLGLVLLLFVLIGTVLQSSCTLQ